MKVRNDFVTNSSSSSFVISKNDITHGELEKILIEIANRTQATRYEDEEDLEPIDSYIEIYDAYEIIDATEENPYDDYNDNIYTCHYIVDNNCTIRYEWDIVEEVLAKYNIPWEYGYCD